MESKIAAKLKELEETSSDFWNIPRETGNFLNMLIKATNSKNLLEVGTSNGYSAIWQSMAAKETGGKLITIEFHQKRIDMAVVNLTHCGLIDYVDIKQGSASNVLETLTKEDYNTNEENFLDYAFVDANKSEYIKYYTIIDSKLKKGGIIAVDNVFSHKEKIVDFTEAIENNPNYQISYFDWGGGLLVGLKLN